VQQEKQLTNKKPNAYWDQGDVGLCLYDKETSEELGGVSEAQNPEGQAGGWLAMFYNTRSARKSGFKSATFEVTSHWRACDVVSKLAEEAGYDVNKI
jgi:hypothetical protein